MGSRRRSDCRRSEAYALTSALLFLLDSRAKACTWGAEPITGRTHDDYIGTVMFNLCAAYVHLLYNFIVRSLLGCARSLILCYHHTDSSHALRSSSRTMILSVMRLTLASSVPRLSITTEVSCTSSSKPLKMARERGRGGIVLPKA